MLQLIVTMDIKAGRMEEFLTVCKTLRPEVLKEAGCLAYDYTREVPSFLGGQEPIDANRITLLERWASPEALKAHLETPHLKAAGPKLKELRSGVSVRVLESLF
jgi:quinol monooxygenase YgiN